MENLPFTIVECISFINSQRILRYNIYVPTAYMIRKFVSENFVYTKLKIKNILQSLPGKISFSVDGWSDLSMNHFIGVTCQFIYNKEIQSVGIGFERTDNLSGDAQFKVFIKILQEYNLEKKILCVTTDNGISIYSVSCNKWCFY